MIDNNLIKNAFTYFFFGSFTIIIALAWNNAFTSFIQTYLPNKEHNVIGQFTYAFVLTIIFIIFANTFFDKSFFESYIFK
jgi:uncharacterized membrane protein (DUF485 family)